MADGRGEARRWAPPRGIITMARRKIRADISAEIAPFNCVRSKGMSKRLRDQIVLRTEMAIETTVGEAGGFHYLRNAHRVEPLVAKQAAGDIQNPLTVFRHLLPADLHFKFSTAVIDIYMTAIIFRLFMMIIMNIGPIREKSNAMTTIPSVLITGASTGIGASYAERFARRGHDLVLVARDVARMEALASRLRQECGVAIDVIQADLTQATDLATVETRLRDDARIGILINNAGTAIGGSFIEQSTDDVARLVALNTTALLRLASAIAPRLAKSGDGAIVNIGSVVGLAPEFGMTVYGATKAFVLFLSQGLSLELGPKGVYVQAVLPATTRTEIWGHVGADVNALSNVMEVNDLVDAALVGFDRREPVTIPPLPDAGQWDALETARQAMLPNYRNALPAARYLTVG